MAAFAIPMHARNTVVHPNGLWAIVTDRDGDSTYPIEEQLLWIWSLRRSNPSHVWDASNVRGACNGAQWPPANITTWLREMMAVTNNNFKAFAGNPEAPPTVAVPDGPWPATFEEFQAWFVANLAFKDTAAGPYVVHRSQLPAEQPPAPPVVGGFTANGAFDIGKQRLVWNLVVGADGAAVMRCQRWIGPGPDDWQRVRFE